MGTLRRNDSSFSIHSPARTPPSSGSPALTECDADDEGQNDGLSMSGDDAPAHPRSLSVSIPQHNSLYGGRRPVLREILSNTAPPPWTLAALMAYLSTNHCLETLEFTMDAGRYKKHYTKMMAKVTERNALPSEQDVANTRILWQRLVDAYIRPNGSREINIPSQVRDPILNLDISQIVPTPDMLEVATAKVYELMEESVLVPFLESVTPRPPMEGLSGHSPTFDSFPKELLAASGDQPQVQQNQQQQRELAAYSHSNRFFRNSQRSSGSADRATSPLISSSSSSTTSSRRSPPETFAAVFSRHRFSNTLGTTPAQTPSSAYPTNSSHPTSGNWSDTASTFPSLTDDSLDTASISESPTTPGRASSPSSPSSQRNSANWKKIRSWSGWRQSHKHSMSLDYRDQSAPL